MKPESYVIPRRIELMEPLLPTQSNHGDVELKTLEVIRRSSALGSMLHPTTREAIVRLLRNMNSYYSNLIEGHFTHPLEIEKALKGEYSKEPAKRARQVESRAHIEVQVLMESRIKNKDLNICSEEFLCWLHSEFYKRLPKEFTEVKSKSGEVDIVIPGELRCREVEVGQHIPPKASSLKLFMRRFEEAYNPEKLSPLQHLSAAAAAHHRLAWIHPFLDGNGRVIRLFTHAYLIKARVDGFGLWSAMRGFARSETNYKLSLAEADSLRRGDLDGRGHLSESALRYWCNYFLDTCLDQIDFMSRLLQLDELQDRIQAYIERQASFGKMKWESFYLIRDVMLRGEVPRGEAARIMGMSERSAREILKELLELGLLTSDSPKTGLKFGCPAASAGYYFPSLFPEGIEMTLN